MWSELLKTLLSVIVIATSLNNQLGGDCVIKQAEPFKTTLELIQDDIAQKEEKRKQNMIKEIREALTNTYKDKREKERIEQEERDFSLYYDPDDVRIISGISKDRIRELLSNTTYCNDEVVDELYNLEHSDKPINCLFVIAISKLESGNGNSSLAQSHNNLGGIKSRSGGYQYFDSHSNSIKSIGDLLVNYVYEYNIGNSIWQINTKYCESSDWSSKLIKIINEMG